MSEIDKTSAEYIISLFSNPKNVFKALKSLNSFYETPPFSKVEQHFVNAVISFVEKNNKDISGVYLENSVDLCVRYVAYLQEIAIYKQSQIKSANNTFCPEI